MKNVMKLEEYKLLDFKIAKVNIEFALDADETIVKTELHIKYNKQQQIFLNGENLQLQEITLDKKKIQEGKDYLLDETGLTLLDAPKEFKLYTKVVINPKANKDLQGLYVSGDMLCSKCETEGFRRITFFPDRPDAMARYTTTIIADKNKYPVLLSNGNIISKKNIGKDKHKIIWNDNFRKACYVFAIVAGDFEVVKDSFKTSQGKNIRLGVYVEKGKGKYASYAMQSLKKAMKWDEEYFGRIFDLKYMNIVATKDFNSGACENKGLNIFNDKYILVDERTSTELDYKNVDLVVAHEYFHNWSGNKITIQNWFNLALKEGLTVYRTQKYAKSFYAQDNEKIEEAIDLIQSQFKYDNSPMAHPIIPKEYTNVRAIYNTTTYEKGAKILQMMEDYVGEKIFNQAIQNFFDKYQGTSANYRDLIAEVQALTSDNLEKLANWFDITGTPKITIEDSYNPDNKTYRLNLSHNNDKDLLVPLTVSMICNGIEQDASIVLDNNYKTFTFKDVPCLPITFVNADFNAPVEIENHHPDVDLAVIIKTSKHVFARYMAMQKYMINAVVNNDKEVVNVIRDIINDKILSDEIKTKFLAIPSTFAIADASKDSFVNAYQILKKFVSVIAKQLEPDLNNIVTDCKSYNNLVLNYLAYLPEYKNTIIDTYYGANNMTTKFNAFVNITANDYPERLDIINDFYNQYSDNHLVVNKWFAAQAMSPLPDTMARVENLVNHPEFSYSNPNKVFALIGSFARNVLYFHQENGAGYKFFADSILQVDKVNPQIAVILLDFFGLYPNLSAELKKHINETLQELQTNGSRLLKDKIQKLL